MKQEEPEEDLVVESKDQKDEKAEEQIEKKESETQDEPEESEESENIEKDEEINLLDEFYYLDFRLFYGGGWYQKYEGVDLYTRDYAIRIYTSDENFFEYKYWHNEEYYRIAAAIRELRQEHYRLYQGRDVKYEVGVPSYCGDEFPFSLYYPTFGYQNCKAEYQGDDLKSFVFRETRDFGIDMRYFRYDEVVFEEPINIEHGDERYDTNSHGDIKHNADYVNVEVRTWKRICWGWYKRQTDKLVISKELFRHILSPANFHVSDSLEVNSERMKRAARTCGSVNISKYFTDRGQNVNNNTFLVANYYMQHFYLAKPHLVEALALN